MSGNVAVSTSSRPLGTAALVVGLAAIVVASFGWVPLVAAPGSLTAITVMTILTYLLPVAGVVVGHVARRREGRSLRALAGLVLSYLAAVVVVAPIVVGLVDLALQR
jgi:drug/metabolite transporter (DMT)-like permease